MITKTTEGDTPGSPIAIARRCLCSPFLNRNGKGTTHGSRLFISIGNAPFIVRAHSKKPMLDRALKGGRYSLSYPTKWHQGDPTI
jgi:hypothetical protein